MTITFAVSKWRHYLEQGTFIIKIDHESIKYLLEQRLQLHTNLQQKGIAKLLGLDYKILYRKRVENKAADAPSRRPGMQASVAVVYVSKPVWMEVLAASYEGDSKATELFTQIAISSDVHLGYFIKNEVLLFKDKMYVGKCTALRANLLQLYHN